MYMHSNQRLVLLLSTHGAPTNSGQICNFVGNERVFGSLKWNGLADFRYQQDFNKQVWAGGLWWESGPLRYVRVNGAGHMVPMDKPKHAMDLFKAWLDKAPLV